MSVSSSNNDLKSFQPKWQMRQWSEFFDNKTFHLPGDWNKAPQLIRDNCLYYFANYCVVLIGVTLIIMLIERSLMIPIGLSVGAYAIAFIVFGGNQRVGSVIIDDKIKWGVFSAIVLLSIYLSDTLIALLWSFGIASILIFSHATVKHATLKSKATLFVDKNVGNIIDKVKDGARQKLREVEEELK